MDPEEELILGAAVREVAAQCGVAHGEFRSVGELVGEIQQANPEIRGDLTEFMTAHLVWFRFHEDLHRRGKLDNMSREETTRLVQLVDERNAVRKTLLAALARRKHAEVSQHSVDAGSPERAGQPGPSHSDRTLPKLIDGWNK